MSEFDPTAAYVVDVSAPGVSAREWRDEDAAAWAAFVGSLSIRSGDILERGGVTSFRALCGLGVEGLCEMRGMGMAHLAEIVKSLARVGRSLRATP